MKALAGILIIFALVGCASPQQLARRDLNECRSVAEETTQNFDYCQQDYTHNLKTHQIRYEAKKKQRDEIIFNTLMVSLKVIRIMGLGY
jgi:hypothetical protein